MVGKVFVARTTAKPDQEHEQDSIDHPAPPSDPCPRPAARIALVRFALAEIEQLPEDAPPAR